MYVKVLRAQHCPEGSFTKPGGQDDAGFDLAMADDGLIPPLSEIPRELVPVKAIDQLSPSTLESIGYVEGKLPEGSPFTIKDAILYQMGYRPPLFRTGIHVLSQDPSSGWFMIALRSSAGTKVGLRLHNGIGVIDGPYRREILLPLYSAYDVPILVPKGERVAQLIPLELPRLGLAMSTDMTLVQLDEGRGGFGSTNDMWGGMSGEQVIASFER